jgi:ribonuclease HII
MDLWQIERELHSDGYKLICGVDEAGRGPLAGSVFAAAVIFPVVADIPGLDDSKKLSGQKREKLYDEIINIALAYAVSSADNREVDELNILNATFLAMNRAIETLSVKPDMILIDGNSNRGIKAQSRCIVGGDAISASIAAASILAKVSRDRHMIEMAKTYPQYVFEKHKGYGTKLHYEKLREHGISGIHRKSFLKRLNNG